MSSPRGLIAALTLSAAAFVGLLGYEGYCETACVPIPGDVPTIGFGTTGGVRLGDRTTPVQAVRRALADIDQFESAVKKCVKVPLKQTEYDAYIQLSYNIGSTAFCNSTLVKKLNAGDYAGACAQISRWNRAQGKEVRGLTLRRAEERKTCELP